MPHRKVNNVITSPPGTHPQVVKNRIFCQFFVKMVRGVESYIVELIPPTPFVRYNESNHLAIFYFCS
jgi:hypothetical protein